MLPVARKGAMTDGLQWLTEDKVAGQQTCRGAGRIHRQIAWEGD